MLVAVETARLLVNSRLFWIRFITVFIALLALAYKNSKIRSKSTYKTAFTFLLISEFIGRLQE
ncbi:MAG: hypothetical protein ACQEXB_27335 [Bacillota bacterium]